ncbi:hypothetical protein MA16_Dca014153 [Dendrobium catenatum]|uniref:Uncharacterized protein n=1 Tax=Dendrobium catenatum TaxID=906689 RepID=A0A2I0VTL8_9ASPA|nr:hypothetical protein MA16_Dca014153 [Dendrobium catenatum]
MQSTGKPISEKIRKRNKELGAQIRLGYISSISTHLFSYGDAQTQRFPLHERAIQAAPAPSRYLKQHWKNSNPG